MYRRFSPTAEATAARWREICIHDGEWEVQSGVGAKQGEAKGFIVQFGSDIGYAKPGRDQPPVSEHPRAAHEKIAADLAFELGLPVPPAVLWDRGAMPNGTERYCAISLLCFEPVYQWAEVSSLGQEKVNAYLPELSRLASAIAPFDTWLQNSDRNNPGNLICSSGKDNGSFELKAAYIDYAHTMLMHWKIGHPPTAIMPVGLYPPQCEANLEAIYESVKKIEELPEAIIECVVKRIPLGFVASDEQRTLLLSRLLERRSQIRGAMQSIYSVES